MGCSSRYLVTPKHPAYTALRNSNPREAINGRYDAKHINERRKESHIAAMRNANADKFPPLLFHTPLKSHFTATFVSLHSNNHSSNKRRSNWQIPLHRSSKRHPSRRRGATKVRWSRPMHRHALRHHRSGTHDEGEDLGVRDDGGGGYGIVGCCGRDWKGEEDAIFPVGGVREGVVGLFGVSDRSGGDGGIWEVGCGGVEDWGGREEGLDDRGDFG
jgi:hypothetical protein